MKLKPILIFTVLFIAILSCKREQIGPEQNVIDLSSFGSVNMIKEIGGQIYILNSTKSSIHTLNGNKIELFRDLNISGRDFLLDFDIEGDKVYYSNTYDEIFISSGNAIEDTVKVLNPDRVAVVGSNLFVTSRKSEKGNIYLKRIGIRSKKEMKKIALNDSVLNEMKFAQATIAESGNELWVMNPFRNKMEKYNTDLKITESINLPEGFEYGNFSVRDNGIKLIASKDTLIHSASVFENSEPVVMVTGINSNDIDIRSSCVTKDKIILYDFIKSSIIIYLTK